MADGNALGSHHNTQLLLQIQQQERLKQQQQQQQQQLELQQQAEDQSAPRGEVPQKEVGSITTMYSCLIPACEPVTTKAEPMRVHYPQEHNGATAKPVQRVPGSQQQILPAGQRQGRPQPAVPPFQQQVSRPQGFKMQASQTKDTLANNKANLSEFNLI